MMGLATCRCTNVNNEAAELLLSAQFLAERNDIMATEKMPAPVAIKYKF